MDSAMGLSCWVISNGYPGMENQCLGLAEAMRLKPVVKRVKLRPFWQKTAPYIRIGAEHALDTDAGDSIAPPWPDVVIASGRDSILPALTVKKLSKRASFIIQIQSPGIRAKNFDLVIVPEHDKLRGDNVLVSRGAMHRISKQRLQSALTDEALASVADLPRPLVTVLIGGTNGVYEMGPAQMEKIASDLAQMAQQTGAGLLVTPSRRTGAENEKILREKLTGLPAHIWDGKGENPYFKYLTLADHLVVTCDSVSMVSEAAATGKPVHVIKLPGGSDKFNNFHFEMEQEGITRTFTPDLPSWTYPEFNETKRVAREVMDRLAGPALRD